jgi:hypothetical protein
MVTMVAAFNRAPDIEMIDLFGFVLPKLVMNTICFPPQSWCRNYFTDRG